MSGVGSGVGVGAEGVTALTCFDEDEAPSCAVQAGSVWERSAINVVRSNTFAHFFITTLQIFYYLFNNK